MKNKIIHIVLIIVLILIFVLGGLLTYRNLKQENIVKDELEVINSLNASTDTINMEIKASGDYANVEKAIKEYYTDYFANKKIFNDNRVEALFNTLTVSYLKENKSKLKSLKLDKRVDDKTKELNEAVNNIINMLDKDNIMAYVNKYDLKDYYNNFYQNNMVSKNDSTIKKEWKDLMDENTKKADYLKEIIKILVNNSNSWYVEDNQLYFLSDNLLKEYNNLHSLIYDNDINTVNEDLAL